MLEGWLCGYIFYYLIFDCVVEFLVCGVCLNGWNMVEVVFCFGWLMVFYIYFYLFFNL